MEQVAPAVGMLRKANVNSGLSAPRSPALPKLRMAGAWDEPEQAKATLELMQIRSGSSYGQMNYLPAFRATAKSSSG